MDQQRVDKIASLYFTNLFPERQIEVCFKTGGVQLGNRIKIHRLQEPEGPEEPETLTYYVKTHSDGLVSQKSAAAETVNPVELMVYRILQKLGVGCESHFFGRDEKNFYIATKDAGCDGSYLSYRQLQEKKEYKEVLDSEGFSNGIFCLDLLSRLLRLTDLQTNQDNFGLVKDSDGWHVRAIDFRLRDEHNPRIYKDNFEGFLVGNTQVTYSD